MKKTRRKRKKRKRIGCTHIICWTVLPIALVALLVLDALGFYTFNGERLLVMGACALVVLIPLFSEITVKSISFKRKENSEEK
ncbi:MAG: hypothetical protein J6V09_06115 [Clostridia bacterium]|nr:hypothetical protein [Clostridia bacterium]